MRFTLFVLTIYCIQNISNVKGFWIRDFDTEEDDISLTMESAFERPNFNSRGPRSVYRGLEDGGDFFIEDYTNYQDYHDFDFEYSE